MPKLRKAVIVGVSAAAATAAIVSVAGPALADTSELTKCTDTVRVRSQPSQSAPVIGSCKAGESVTVDDSRDGFAHLANKQGWASIDFLDLSDSKFKSSSDSRDDDRYGSDRDRDGDRYSTDSDDDNDRDYDNNDDDDDNGVLGGLGG
jgi:uncharacterized protein YraI